LSVALAAQAYASPGQGAVSMEGSVKGWTDYLGFRIAGDAL